MIVLSDEEIEEIKTRYEAEVAHTRKHYPYVTINTDTKRLIESLKFSRTTSRELSKENEILRKERDRAETVEYNGGIISVGGRQVADHSELPKENERLFKWLHIAQGDLCLLHCKLDHHCVRCVELGQVLKGERD